MIDINRIRNFIFGPGDNNGIGVGRVFSIGGFAFPLVALWNPRAVVPLVALLSLWSVFNLVRAKQHLPLKKFDILSIISVSALFGAVIISSIQAPDSNGAFITSSKIFGNLIVAIGLIFAASHLTDQETLNAAKSILIATCIVAVFFLTDILSQGALSLFFTNMTYTPKYKFFWFKSASSSYAICAFIAAFYLVLRNKIWWALALLGVSILITVEIGNRTAAGGLFLGVLVGGIYHLLGRWRKQVISTVIIVIVASPLYLFELGFSAERISNFIHIRASSTLSVVYRMHTWEFVLNRIQEKPLLGWGVRGSKLFGEESSLIISDPLMGELGEAIPLHPHNGVLQIWLELGAFGAFALLMVFLRAIYVIDKRCTHTNTRIWTFGILTLLGCFFTFSYGVFSSAWIAILIFSFAMTTALSSIQSNIATGHRGGS